MANEESKIETPQLTMGERKEQRVLATLGSATGWAFVERQVLDVPGKSDATGARLKSGVMIKNVVLGKTMFMGEGEAEKYTDVVILKPASARKPRQAKAGVTEKVRKPRATMRKVAATEVEEIDLDELAASLQ